MTDQKYKLPPLVGVLLGLKPHVKEAVKAYGEACAATAIAAAPEPACRFTRWDDGSYTPGCDQNQYVGRALRYCPHCGKRIEVEVVDDE